MAAFLTNIYVGGRVNSSAKSKDMRLIQDKQAERITRVGHKHHKGLLSLRINRSS